jgi:hypothetical protein
MVDVAKYIWDNPVKDGTANFGLIILTPALEIA